MFTGLAHRDDAILHFFVQLKWSVETPYPLVNPILSNSRLTIQINEKKETKKPIAEKNCSFFGSYT